MSCGTNTPVVNNLEEKPRVVLSSCLLNIDEVTKETPDAPIKDFTGCDILTPYTARQILLNNL